MFFTNSGTEANEAAFKLTRRTGRTHLVAAEGSFHGRTMGSLALTSKEAYRDAVRAAAGRRHVRPVRRRGRARPGRHRRDRRRDPRAHPGRGRCGRPAGRLPVRGPRDHPRQRRPALARRGADRHRPHRRVVRRRRRRRRHRHRRQGPRRRHPDRRLHRPRRRPRPCSSRATTAPPSAATRSPAPPPSPSSTPSRRTASSTTRRSTGERLRAGLAADARVTEVRGRGLLVGARPVPAVVAPRSPPPPLAAGFIVNNPTPDRVRLAPPLVIGHDDVDAFLAAWPGILDDAYGGPRSDSAPSSPTTTSAPPSRLRCSTSPSS